jgi:uncharacterized protein (TIGR03437 family)
VLLSVLAATAAVSVARAAVIYTFNGVTIRDGRVEAFQYTSPGFIGALVGIDAAKLDSCTGCGTPFGPIFSPDNGGLGDQIQFDDSNGSGYEYMFPPGALAEPGTYTSQRPFNTGTLTVQVTDDLAIANSAGYELCGPGQGMLCAMVNIAPGENATIFGSDNIADTTAQASSVTPPNSLGGLTVTFVDSAGVSRSAPLFYVSPRQVNLQVPPDCAPGRATIIVVNGTGVALLTANIANVAPGIYTANGNGAGVPAAQLVRVHADGSQSIEGVIAWDASTGQWIDQPIALGSDVVYLVLYATGIRNSAGPVEVDCGNRVGFTMLSPAYAGPQGQIAGLDQVNVLLQAALAGSGEIYLSLMVDGTFSNAVNLNVK